MLNDFIKNICKNESLEVLNDYGTSAQSSLSKWSHREDSCRPLKLKDCKDFAFHTGYEKNPWWSFTFEDAVELKYVVINNRKKMPFSTINKNISVVTTNFFEVKKTLYSGSCHFGSLPDSLPLILRIDSLIKTNKVEVILQDINYLHLGPICFLGRMRQGERGSREKINLYSLRTDGFGERLKGLLNIMALANHISANFYFSWGQISKGARKFHSIAPPEKVFSQDFINSHVVDKKKSQLKLVSLNEVGKKAGADGFDEDKIREVSISGGFNGVLVAQNLLSNQIKNIKMDSRTYKEIFSNIAWSTELEKAKKEAQAVAVNHSPVAIHLRAGDIVYGFYRYMDRYLGKVIPLHDAVHLLETSKKNNKDVIIFGQDVQLCDFLSKKYGALYSKNLKSESFNEEQSALFDMVLMSRCDKIYAGASGFAVLAGWISGKKVEKEEMDLVSEDDILKILEKLNLLRGEEISSLQISFSLSYLLHKKWNLISEGLRLEIISLCSAIDDENPYYKLVLAAVLYKSEKIELADEAVKSLMKQNKYGLRWFASTVHPDGTTTLLNWIGFYKEAELKSDYAKVVVAYHHWLFCGIEERKTQKDDLVFLEVESFVKEKVFKDLKL